MPGKKKKEDQFELTTHLTRHEEDHHEEEDHLHDEIHHEQMHVEANNIEGAEEQDNDNEEQELHPCSFPIKRRIRRKKLNSKGNSWKGKRFSENHSESNASQNSSTGNLKGLVDSSSSSSDSETEGASCHQEVEGEDVAPRNTDAYGQMEFVGSARRTRARYIRISHETSSEKLSQLLKAMNLTQTPKILVSVVGEMKELDLNQGTIENLKDQLGKVCDKIGAMQKESWFLTSAIDQGATKLIAEAVEGYRFKDTNVIGVVSWKSVSYKSRLKQKSDKIRIPTYPVNESQTQSMISNEEIQEDEESDEEMDFLKMESEISDMINNDDLCNIPQPTSVVDEDEIKPVSIPEQLGSIPEDEDETDVDSFKAREHSSSEPIASSSSAPEQRTEGAGQHTDLNKFRSASDRQTKYDREISSDHQGELQDVFEDGPLSQKAFAQAHWQSESILRPNGKRNKYYLNKDHTHFLLVDTGDCEKKDNRADIEFRCKLERLIVDKQIQKINRKRRELHDRRFRTLGGNFEETNFVPAVQLVINGGYKTMTQIRMTLFPNNGGAPTMPLVVVADSGRASKWIATFCELADQERKQRYILRERRNDLKREIMKCYPIKANEIVGILEEVATERRNFVTIYRQGNNLDDKILQALINTNRNQKTKSQKTIEHHKIVLLWNSPEIAEKDFRKMLNHANSAKAHERKELTRTAHQHMTEIFTRALKKQNVQFFRMLLKLDMDITRFTHRMLIDLYDKPCSTGSSNVISSFKKGSSNIFTRCCHKLSNEPLALDTLFYRTYKNTKARTEIEREMLQFVQRTINSRILSLELVDYVKNDRNACLLDPFKDLFLWAVTCNKMEIAKALWEHGENPIAKALIARKIFLKTAEAYTDHSQYDAHIHAKLEENARYFSDKAIQLLEQCSKEKTEDTKQLINKPIPGWGKKTLIELAALSDFQEFICLPRCKDINDQKWRAGIVPMDGEFINLKLSFTVILLFFPWLFFIRYKKDQIHSCNRCKEVHDGSAGPPAQPIQRRSTPLKCIFTKAGDKIKAFFSAPISKFWCNFISYIYFLMFFNFMALNQLDEGPGKLAYVLLCYIIAFTLEEIRQIKDEIGLKFKHKLRRYFKSTWNKLETVSIIIFIGAFTLHLQPIEREEYRSYARFMYSAVLFLCVMKLLQLLSLFRKIGVYVVMLQKMLIDVAYFVLILAVLVIGYAVARFSVLYPKERFGFSSKSTPNLMRKVFLVPIFQLFGESFIDKPEEAEGANNITVFGTPEYNNIEGYGEVVVLWFTFIYMVLTSLLLVNMLIAVFNFTYSVVEKNADEVWHWQNYNLVREYEGKSRFPAPFSILSHLRDLVVYLWQKIKERKPKPDTSSGNDKTDSKGCSTKHRSLNEYFNEQAELNELIQFERDCLGHHLNELIKQEKAQEEAQRKILKQLTTETNKKQYWRWPAINLSRRKNSITGLDVARPNSQPTSPLTRAFTSPPDLVKPK